jgi:hypothetical protein
MISILLFTLAALIYGLISAYLFHYDDTVFAHWASKKGHVSFWHKQSWVRKYKAPLRLSLNKNRYYRWFNLKYLERFPLSATALVFTTDGFHFLQAIMLLLLAAALVTANLSINWIIGIVIYRVAWGIAFEFGYSFLSMKKYWGIKQR